MSKSESVWDYPRPPKVERFSGHIRVVHQNVILIDTNKAYRVLETSHPPTYYLPISELQLIYFKENNQRTGCEFKGTASYIDLQVSDRIIQSVGWFYKSPNKSFMSIQDHISLYASKIDECYVNDELVMPQEGDLYGGWITKNIKGPFKGGAGTFGW